MIKEVIYGKRLRFIKIAIAVLVLLLIIAIVYAVFSYIEVCSDKECFDQYLVECRRVKWTNNAEEAVWAYRIEGASQAECRVGVTLLSVKTGQADLGIAEKKSMTCYLPLNVVLTPGENLEYCTGPLKETMQDLIIKKMHSYILENLGRINEELTRAI